MERWLEGEGEGVLVTTARLFRGCEAPAVVWVARYGGWWGRIAATRAVAALLLITSDRDINCDNVYKYFDQFTPMSKVIKAGGKEVAERKGQCYTKKSKGMLLCLLLLYFIVSLSMQRLFS